jgi:hypothetical protein
MSSCWRSRDFEEWSRDIRRPGQAVLEHPGDRSPRSNPIDTQHQVRNPGRGFHHGEGHSGFLLWWANLFELVPQTPDGFRHWFSAPTMADIKRCHVTRIPQQAAWHGMLTGWPDPEKKKYFRIQADHVAPPGASYARGAVAKRKAEQEVSKHGRVDNVVGHFRRGLTGGDLAASAVADISPARGKREDQEIKVPVSPSDGDQEGDQRITFIGELGERAAWQNLCEPVGTERDIRFRFMGTPTSDSRFHSS